MKKSSRGFSLMNVDVVAIILIIAAIAIPNLLRSRIAANQASAVGSLRTLNTAEINLLLDFQCRVQLHDELSIAPRGRIESDLDGGRSD